MGEIEPSASTNSVMNHIPVVPADCNEIEQSADTISVMNHVPVVPADCSEIEQLAGTHSVIIYILTASILSDMAIRFKMLYTLLCIASLN